jgi:hypothetical protein
MDLDDLLDDVEIPEDEEADKNASKPVVKMDEVDLDTELTTRMEEQAVLSFKQTLGQVPASLQDRWIAMVKRDAKAVPPANKLLTSVSYRSWDGSTKLSNNGVSRACSDAVRNACVRIHLDDVKTAKIVNLVNPLEGESAQHLLLLYSKQLLNDTKAGVLQDPNYTQDPAKFPKLSSAIVI